MRVKVIVLALVALFAASTLASGQRVNGDIFAGPTVGRHYRGRLR
jgi:hypothetical protein